MYSTQGAIHGWRQYICPDLCVKITSTCTVMYNYCTHCMYSCTLYSTQVAIHGGRQYICQAAHQITATAAPLNSKSKSTNQCRGK